MPARRRVSVALGRAFGFPNSALSNMFDYNLSSAAGAVIPFESRAPILGFNIPEAVLLDNTGRSRYHSLQIDLVQAAVERAAVQRVLHVSHSMDTSSADPGSTAGGGKPDVPNVGFAVQGDQRNLDANSGRSDFDRPHRFSGSFVYRVRRRADSSGASGCRASCSSQSGLPYSIFAAEPESQHGGQLQQPSTRIRRPLPRRVRPAEPVRHHRRAPAGRGQRVGRGVQPGRALLTAVTGRRLSGQPGLRQPRTERAPGTLAAALRLEHREDVQSGRTQFEFRADIFNVFNTVNFALPEQRHRRRRHRLRPDHRDHRRATRGAARAASDLLGRSIRQTRCAPEKGAHLFDVRGE